MFSKIILLKYEGLIFNIACSLYFLSLGPFVSNAIVQAHRDGKSLPVLAVSIVILMFAETFVLNKKLWNIVLKQQIIPKYSNILIGGLWLMHLILSFMTIPAISFLMGYEIDGNSTDNNVAPIMALAVVIKEFILLFYLPFSGKLKKIRAAKAAIQIRNFRIYDLILFVFSCVLYSAVMETLLYNTDLDTERAFSQLLAFILLFTVLYLPMRFAYFYQEIINIKTGKDSIKVIAAFAFMLLSVYLSKFVIPIFF